MEEDVELPDFLYELDSDEMVEWLTTDAQKKIAPISKFDFEPVASREVRDSLLRHFIQRTLSGDAVDPSVQAYILGNLDLIANGNANKPELGIKIEVN